MTALPSGPPGYCDVTGVRLPSPTLATARTVAISHMSDGSFRIRALGDCPNVSMDYEAPKVLADVLWSWAEARKSRGARS